MPGPLIPVTVGQARRLARAEITQPVVRGGITEWWIQPVATYLSSPYPRTVFGAISGDGEICACELNHATGATRRYALDTVAPDDHKAPALWIAEGRRPIIMWQSHGQNDNLRYRVGSASGNIGTFLSTSTALYAPGGSVAYAQLFKVTALSDSTQDTFWVFYRASGDGWRMVPMTVTQESGNVSFGTTIAVFESWGDTYLSIADAHKPSGNQTLRIAAAENPNDGHNNVIRYVELDCVTGAFSSPIDPDLSANIDGTNLPMTTSVAPIVPAQSSGNSRRLFYVRPGPDDPAIAYADWADATPDAATYKVVTWIDAQKALIPTTPGGATGGYESALEDANGFTATAAILLPSSAPASGFYVMDRSAASSNDGWAMRISSTSFIGRVKLSGGDFSHSINYSSWIRWGTVMGFRMQVDIAHSLLKRWYSYNPLDASPTWTALSSVAISGTVVATTRDLHVMGSLSATVAQAVYYAELKNSSGTVVAGVDWRTEWDAGDTTFTDDASIDWTLETGTSVANADAVPITTTYGTAGPRVGYVATSNYIAGMCFEDPSDDGVVIVARSANGVESVERYFSDDETETLLSQDTAAGRLIRPYAPMNGGPVPALISDVSSYSANSYEEFVSDVRAT